MGGLYHDALGGLRLDPAAQSAAAGKDEPVNGVTLDHGELQVAVVRSDRDPFPCRADAAF